MNLHGTVSVSGLGGNPYRDGSFEYYMSEPVIVNDPKGMGAFLKCAVEMEMLTTLPAGKGKTVLLDRFFNSEKRKDVAGKEVYWHYVWEEKSNPGFSFWGNIFERYGAKTASLDVAPTADNLKNASVYIIVDPDHLKDNPNANFLIPKNINAISDWVSSGGVLILMANDSANCELGRFNELAKVFGLQFTDKNLNMVKNDVFEQGLVLPGNKNSVFQRTGKMYLKEISTLELSGQAKAICTKDGDVIMAVSKFRKGTVFAVGDPWLYNEYVDGRKLPAEYENYNAAVELVKWVLKAHKL
ncbi:MAG: hypothetical protein HC867_06835 [Bacteroidia bacterium]|nr:hypothetical protein [Bacteroidia bacterium]